MTMNCDSVQAGVTPVSVTVLLGPYQEPHGRSNVTQYSRSRGQIPNRYLTNMKKSQNYEFLKGTTVVFF